MKDDRKPLPFGENSNGGIFIALIRGEETLQYILKPDSDLGSDYESTPGCGH